MKSLLKIYHTILIIALPAMVMAQKDQLIVSLSSQQLQPGDRVDIKAAYTVNGKAPQTATLFLNILNEEEMSWQVRWPILDGVCEASVIIPDSMPAGRYQFYFSALQAFFTVKGQVKEPRGVNLLKSVLLTGNGEYIQRDVPVARDGSFEYRNSLFPDTAILSFAKKSGGNSDLDISIRTVLDSIYWPSGKTVRGEIRVGKIKGAETDPVSKLTVVTDTTFAGKAKSLPAVVVFGQRRSRGDRFNDKYSRGLFADMSGKTISFLDNPGEGSGLNVLQYLNGRVAGLNINTSGRLSASWRGDRVAFYLDEMRVDIQQISFMNTNDIAIIKTYPPPFFGNPGGSGGAVAIYTKRGDDDEAAEGNRNTFKVRGYAPLLLRLPVKPTAF